MKVTFWGAARTVTGSMHLLETGASKILLDCGTYQGRRQESRERNTQLPFRASEIDSVLLSHAHIDHSGNLPSLVKNGFSGPIRTSPATADLCDPLLTDSANIQEKDALFINKRLSRRRALLENDGDGEIQPVYTAEDVERTLPLFERVLLHSPTQIDDVLTYESFDAGHILGSTFMVLESRGKGRHTRLGFSGDIGRPDLPIVPDPEPCPPVDYLILESTYGDRLHKPLEQVEERLAQIVIRTYERGGKIVVPAFALGRTQQLVLVLHTLTDQGRIPKMPVFVDSPLASKMSKVYRAHHDAQDTDTQEWSRRGLEPFAWRQLRYTQDVNESKAINDLRTPCIIISASGMCEAGRILHHLRNNIPDPRNTVLITGFQAEHTLGRKIVDGYREVPIFGEPVPLRAEVAKLNELSGHGDQHELLNWIGPIARGLKKVFLVHGEYSAQQTFARAITERYEVPVAIPQRGESFDL